MHADAERVAAQMPPARTAIAALAADDMPLARDTLADMIPGDTLISTSLGPGSGTGTCSIHRPASGLDLTSAFIMFVMEKFLQAIQMILDLRST
jgi:hypothetical protein